jgi:hypothetical protein
LGYGRDDNLTQSNTNVISSDGYQVKLGLLGDAQTAQTSFKFDLSGVRNTYKDSDADNFTDFFSRASYDMQFTERASMKLGWDYIRGHDGRGSTDRGIGTEVDKWYTSTPRANFVYGAPSARGRFEVYADYGQLRYRNNEAAAQQSDRDTTNFGGAFYWRVAPKTSLLVEARGTEYDYKTNRASNSKETRYYGGVTWDATAATSGTLRVGRLEKKFDDGAKPKTADTSWEASVNWAPLTYSRWVLITSRQTNESTGLGDYILTDSLGLAWNHEWTSYITTNANARLTKDRYRGFDRTDDIMVLGISATYKFRKWVSFSAAYEYSERESNVDVNNYDRNKWLLSAEVSM